MLHDLFYRLRALLRRGTVEKELDEELRFHFDRQVEEFLKAGMSRQEALRQARLAFGGLDQIKEECRQARGVSAIETTLQDVRCSLRGFRRNSAFTLIAVLTLALTTGAVATAFNLAYSLFYRPLPLEDPQEIVAVTPTRQHGSRLGFASYPDYLAFRDGNHTLRGLAAHYSTSPLFALSGDHSQEINGAVVSANFFSLLGLQPALGRFFRPEEDSVPDRDRVAVLGYGLWRDWFGASPDALGKTLSLNGTAFTVIGVMPESFPGLAISPSQVYLPLMMMRVGYRWCEDSLSRDCTILGMIGRLAKGRTLQEAQSEMATLLPPYWVEAEDGSNSGVKVERWQGVGHGPSETRLIRLLVLVSGILLLVGCANLSALLIARGSARRREFAIRTSLGAARLRLIRQLLTESLLLALAGGTAGIVVSLTFTDAIRSSFYSSDSEGHRLYYDFSLEPAVVLAALAVSVTAGILFGLLPALQASRSGPIESLKQHGHSLSGRSAWRNGLVAGQAAAAVALATVAALLMASAATVAAGVNFDPSQVALMRLRPRLLGYPPEKGQQFVRQVIERLEALPAVESASMSGTGSVLWGLTSKAWLPQWPEQDGQALSVGYGEIGPRYFETLRIPLLQGREFDSRDRTQTAPVAIVNQALARRLWPSESPIGATLALPSGLHQVVGLAQDLPVQSRNQPVRPCVYVPFWQNPDQVDARLAVRLRGDPAALLPELVREASKVDPQVPIAETIPMDLEVAGVFRPLRLSASFVSFTAGLALLLSALGLYGALAFAVSRRRKEIGIRMAIGAKPSGVRAMVVREGMIVIAGGIAVGVGLALAGIRLVHHLLVGASATDPGFIAASALLVAATGLLACWIPARRAARVEPVAALREE